MTLALAAPTRTRMLPMGLAAAVAVALMALSVPRVLASLATFEGSSELRALKYQKPVSDADLQAIVSAQEARLGWLSSPRFDADLGLAALMLHDRSRDPALLEKGEQAIVRSLRGNPADPYAWARLAYARDRRGAAPEGVTAALVMSILTGPHEPRLVPSRLDLGIRYWPLMTADQKDIARGQIRYGMRVAWRAVVASAADPFARGVIRGALASDPHVLARFESALKRVRR